MTLSWDIGDWRLFLALNSSLLFGFFYKFRVESGYSLGCNSPPGLGLWLGPLLIALEKRY